MNKTIYVILSILLVFVLSVFVLRFSSSEDTWLCSGGEWVKHGEPAAPAPATSCGATAKRWAVDNFEDCVTLGNPVMESYPRQCRAKDGKIFVEKIGNELEKIDLIRLNNPRPNQVVSSPLKIEGEARGYWFFEGDFPIELLDGNDNLIVESFATAENEWMTENFVSFSAELNFTVPATKKATLILKKDNPSGLPENDEQLEIPLFF